MIATNDATKDAVKSVNLNISEFSEIDLNHITVASNIGPNFTLANCVTLTPICVGSDVGPDFGSANLVTIIGNCTVKLFPFQDYDDIDLENIYDSDTIHLI